MTYTPGSYSRTINGMLKKLQMFEAVTQNIANANTIGYKRKMPESLAFQSVLEDAIRDNTQGQLKRTNLALDLAIEGEAFFLVETDKGIIPTRNGKFQLDKDGEIVSQDGHPVVIVEKTDLPYRLAEETDIRIDETGVIHIRGEKYGRIALDIQSNKPVKVHQGYLESSNVSLINEMAALTMIFRSIEASEKSLGMEASADRELIERYGRNV